MSADDGFAPIYDDWAAQVTDDVVFYVSLARKADGPGVGLAVRDGRVAVPVVYVTRRPA